MSSRGMTTSTSRSFRIPASTILTGRRTPGSLNPPRNSAISSSGRWVADRPIRCGGFSAISSSRSSVSARWAPRLVVAIAWISSMITVSTPMSVSRAADVHIRYSDSGVVISRSGGRRISFCRSLDGVSPVRIPTSGAVKPSPKRSAANSMPFNGARKFFSMSNANARSGEMYSTRVRCDRSSGRGVVVSRSIDDKNDASVLPEPVGAQISVCSPD